VSRTTYLFCFIVACTLFFSCNKSSSEEETSITPKEKIISGEFTDNRGIQALCKTHDNHFAIVARKGSSRQLFVSMLTTSLEILWEKSFSTDIDNAGGIIESSDGALVVASNRQVSTNPNQINYGLHLLKISAAGEVIWEKNYLFQSGMGECYPIRQTSDGGFIMGVPYHIPGDPYRFYPTLFKVNSQGDSLWSKGIPGFTNCVVSDIGLTPDQGFLVSCPCALVRTDASGNQIWSYSGGARQSSLNSFSDGSVACWGTMYTSVFIYPLLSKVDGTGNLLWESFLAKGNDIQTYNLCPSATGGFVMTGKIDGVVKLFKTDAVGKLLSEMNLDGYSACGLAPVLDKYCCYTLKVNQSGQFFDLVVRIVE
jgi:hypothetical protein